MRQPLTAVQRKGRAYLGCALAMDLRRSFEAGTLSSYRYLLLQAVSQLFGTFFVIEDLVQQAVSDGVVLPCGQPDVAVRCQYSMSGRATSSIPGPPNVGRGAQTLCLESRWSRKTAALGGKKGRVQRPASYLMCHVETLERETGLEPATLCLGRLGLVFRFPGPSLNLATHHPLI